MNACTRRKVQWNMFEQITWPYLFRADKHRKVGTFGKSFALLTLGIKVRERWVSLAPETLKLEP